MRLPPQTRWWLSYADDSGNKGVCIVLASGDFLHACKISHLLGINPGGEVKGFPIPEDNPLSPPSHIVDRPLTPDEIQEYGKPEHDYDGTN